MFRIRSIIFILISILFPSIVNGQENQARLRGKGELCSFDFSYVHSANKPLISDGECQYLMPNRWLLGKINRTLDEEISTITLERLQLTNIVFAFRVKGPGNSFINLREGNMQFMLNGKVVESSFVMMSLIFEEQKEGAYALQSPYCSGEFKIRNNCTM